MITGVHTPESVHIHFEGLPHADELVKMHWTKLSTVVLALRNRLRHLQMEIDSVTVLKALETLRSERMVWISDLEHCIYSTNLPTEMRCEIVLPSDDAALIQAIIVCNAVTGRYATGVATADGTPPSA